jgi:hypothetical protein
MEIITQREIIKAVADSWKSQYLPHGRGNKHSVDIWNRLNALDLNTASAADVVAIIGNDSWTRLRCHSCGGEVERLIEIGEPPDCESRTARVCLPCITKAYELLVGV